MHAARNLRHFLLLAACVFHAARLWGAPSPEVAFPRGLAAHPTRILSRIRPELRRPEGGKWLADALGHRLVFESRLVSGLVVLDTVNGRAAGPAAVPGAPVDPTPALLAAIAQLEATGWVEFVEPDFFAQAMGSPTEPSLGSGELWGLRNTGVEGGLAGVDIGADAAWQTTVGHSNVVVAVIDSGIQPDHPDLAANIWKNDGEVPGNGIDDDANGYVDDFAGVDLVESWKTISDPNGHGTHVAGTIAALGNGGGRAVGVAWGARVLPIRAGDAQGRFARSATLAAFEYAATSKARSRVINASFGGPIYSEALYLMIRALGNEGILLVCAAGNEAQDNDAFPSFPANYRLPNVISVAALSRDGALADFSNYGAEGVHVAAPGQDVLSTSPGSTYSVKEGTSMAAPHVSGIAALILSIYPSASVVEMRQRILQSCMPLPALGNKVVTGGVVRADRALRLGPDGIPDFDLLPTRWRSLVVNRSNRVEILVSDVRALVGGVLEVRLGPTPPVNFTDDGAGLDEAASDGVYTGSLFPLAAGDQTVVYRLQTEGQIHEVRRLASVADRPDNDFFVERTQLSAGSISVRGTLEGASVELDEPDLGGTAGGSVWYRWPAPTVATPLLAWVTSAEMVPLVEVFRGTSIATLTRMPGECDAVGFLGLCLFTNLPNQSVAIRVASTNVGQGAFELRIHPATPTNDHQGSAEVIWALENIAFAESRTGISFYATREAGEPVHAGAPGGRSLWWRFTAPSSGVLRVDTRGSSFDTLLAVYRLGSLNAVGANDNAVFAVQWSSVGLPVQAGETYQIAVDGFQGASGFVTLNASFNPGSNDDFSAAVPLVAGQTVSGANFGATWQTFEPVFPTDLAGASVWYKWTAPSGGRARVIVTPRNTGLNLKAAVYHDRARQDTLNVFSNLRTITYDRDESTSGGAILDIPFDAAAGQEYRISVDGLHYTEFFIFDAWERGNFDIRVELLPAIGLIYRTGFEVNWEGLLQPVLSAGEVAFTTPGIAGIGAARMVQGGASASSWTYPFLRLDGYGPLSVRMSFRMESVAADAGWVIGLMSLPMSAGTTTFNEDRALAGVLFDGAGVESAVFNYQSGLASTNPMPAVTQNQRHSLVLTADGGVGLLTAVVDNQPARSVPFTLSGSRNILFGPQFVGTPGAGSLVIDDLEIRSLPRELGVQVPFVRAEPIGTSLRIGEVLQLSAAIGAEGLAYRWYRNGVALSSQGRVSGAESPILTIAEVSDSDGGLYQLIAANSVGEARTTPVTVLVLPLPPAGPTNVVWRMPGLAGAQLGWGDQIVARDGQSMVGVRGRTGEGYWRVNAPQGFVGMAPVATFDDGAVFANAFRASDSSRWILQFDAPVSGQLSGSLRVTENFRFLAGVGDSKHRKLIFVDSTGGGVLDVGTGRSWQHPELGSLGNRVLPFTHSLVGAYFQDDEYGVAAYDYATGTARWRWSYLRRPQLFTDALHLSSIRWGGSKTVLVELSHQLIALDSETGVEKWRYDHGAGSYGLAVFNPETLVGAWGSSANQMFYGLNPSTGASVPSPLHPVIGPISGITQALPLWESYVLQNGGVVLRDQEVRGNAQSWRLSPGSSQTLVGISGSGRVIYEAGGGGLFAITGSDSPLAPRSPSPAPLGKFLRPGSRGYLDFEPEVLRPARGLTRIQGGGVAGIDVMDPGLGYTNRAALTLVGGGGSGAIAEAVMDGTRVLSVTLVSPGFDYTNPPSVRFGPPAYPARPAVAAAQIVNGFIVGVVLSDGGWGYAQPPVVRFVGGNGKGARASAVINADGEVTGIEIDDPGSGYPANSTVWIEPPLIPVPELEITRGMRWVFEDLAVGSSYRLQAEENGWVDEGGPFVAESVSWEFRGEVDRRYRLARLPLPRTATGTLTVVNGFIVGVSITDPGSGYAEVPVVTLTDPAGSGARLAVVVQGGQVVGATVESPGRAYTAAATIRFEGPPVFSIAPRIVPGIVLKYSNVSTNLPYQLHTGPALNQMIPAGAAFNPTSESGFIHRDLDGPVEFFRLEYAR